MSLLVWFGLGVVGYTTTHQLAALTYGSKNRPLVHSTLPDDGVLVEQKSINVAGLAKRTRILTSSPQHSRVFYI
ncbi:hypothetical protein DFA_11538 [Cavenderia fasciculata]|uniref:Uncharacterized protein n=1 Tax=Cavenderia fasciculata TaxID=261658 RepID=F4QDI0_CACFS|nr:uncharacterized protein DFA_11538 [Cavenderia fasciculata]EGG13777.1 hypothetical protein DFA_11538 [Cavenderia fasciculata]|eukprot:XP_004350485.1 hypothetical protein DFA_11538 [Cavenderia fasciculata]